MIPRIVRSKKAISPILATLLLVVIAVAAIVVTYAWIMTYMGNAGRQASVILHRANVNFYNVTGIKKIDVDILNSGTSDTRIIQIYVGTSTATLQNQTITPSNVPAGETQRFTFNYDWTAGTAYHFKVISSSGQSIDWPEPPVNP